LSPVTAQYGESLSLTPSLKKYSVTELQPVTLSSVAAAEVKKIMETKKIPDGYGLRIGVRGGTGCGGAQLIIGFDKPRASDITYVQDGIPVHVDKKHMMYVFGKQVDFYDGADARGFMFVDRKAGE
jgi:iron-sulfur cluster assembly protein